MAEKAAEVGGIALGVAGEVIVSTLGTEKRKKMPLDQDVQQVLELLGQALPGGMHMVPLEELRTILEQMASEGPSGPEVAKTEDRAVDGPRGEVPIRIYWPETDKELPPIVTRPLRS